MNFWNPKHFKSKNGNFCIHCFLRWLYDSGVLRLPANSKVIIQCIYWKASWWRKLRKVSLVKFNVIPLAGVSSRAVQGRALTTSWFGPHVVQKAHWRPCSINYPVRLGFETRTRVGITLPIHTNSNQIWYENF